MHGVLVAMYDEDMVNRTMSCFEQAMQLDLDSPAPYGNKIPVPV